MLQRYESIGLSVFWVEGSSGRDPLLNSARAAEFSRSRGAARLAACLASLPGVSCVKGQGMLPELAAPGSRIAITI